MLKRIISLIIVFVLLAFPTSAAFAGKPFDDGQNGKPADPGHEGKPPENNSKGNQYGLSGKGSEVNGVTETGFDEFGYNRTARIFNGTGLSWCMEKILNNREFCLSYMHPYEFDKLIMKWNAEWDRGNDEGWLEPPYDAWENNEWNGKVPGGSGEVWHYKIVWFGKCTEGATLPDGGYCIWGQFEVIMDQGTSSEGHDFPFHGIPSGYGTYKTKTPK